MTALSIASRAQLEPAATVASAADATSSHFAHHPDDGETGTVSEIRSEAGEAEMFDPIAALTVSRSLLAGRLENDGDARDRDSRGGRHDKLRELEERLARRRALQRALATARIGPQRGELEGSW